MKEQHNQPWSRYTIHSRNVTASQMDAHQYIDWDQRRHAIAVDSDRRSYSGMMVREHRRAGLEHSIGRKPRPGNIARQVASRIQEHLAYRVELYDSSVY